MTFQLSTTTNTGEDEQCLNDVVAVVDSVARWEVAEWAAAEMPG
jgi:hypothetical protein